MQQPEHAIEPPPVLRREVQERANDARPLGAVPEQVRHEEHPQRAVKLRLRDSSDRIEDSDDRAPREQEIRRTHDPAESLLVLLPASLLRDQVQREIHRLRDGTRNRRVSRAA
jgi:hypothetical protein